MNEDEALKERARRIEQAVRRAKTRAWSARWTLETAVFLFAILITILILLFENIGVEIVALVGFFGLAMVWLVGWRQGQQLYKQFYIEELSRYQLDRETDIGGTEPE